MDSPQDCSTFEENLEQLCRLLGVAYSPELPCALSLHHFEEWKPIAQRIAASPEQGTDCVRLAMLLSQVGACTHDPLCLAKSAWTSGNVLLLIDRPLDALTQYAQAEVVYRVQGDALSLARMNVGMVSALSHVGHVHEGINRGHEAMQVLMGSLRPSDQNLLMGLRDNLGEALTEIGQHVESLTLAQQTLLWFKNQLPRTLELEFETARALSNVGMRQLHLGQYMQAKAQLQQARLMLSNLVDQGAPQSDIVRADMNLAWLATLQGLSEQRVQQAFATAKRSRISLDSRLTTTSFALIDLDEANWQIATGHWHEVNVNVLREIQKACANTGLIFEQTYASLLLAQLVMFNGKREEAYQQLVQIHDDAQERGDVGMMYLAQLWCSRVCQRQGRREEAIQLVNAALQVIEQTRRHLTTDDFRVGYLEDKLVAYHDLFVLHLKAQEYSKAFEALERIKAKGLADVLATRVQNHTNFVGKGNNTNALHSPLQMTLLQQVASALPAKTLAINYAIAHGNVWAFVVSAGSTDTPPISLGKAPALDSIQAELARITSIGQLEPAIAKRWLNQQTALAQKSLVRWYEQFIAPLSPWVNHAERLIISPDGLLNLLPFGCFFNAESQRYLAQSHVISLTPSFAAWSALSSAANSSFFATQRPKPGQALQAWVVGLSSNGELPHAVREAQYVAEQLRQVSAKQPISVACLLESQATLQEFQKNAPQANVIYLATHAVNRIDNPSESYLEFANGRMRVTDISAMNLKADWVVLSACETGAGRLSGNELMGLIRAFLHAGARAVLATHWPVNDEATRLLMTEFIRAWSAQHSLGDQPHIFTSSLAAAQRSLIQSQTTPDLFVHPYFWGGFSVMGGNA